MKKILIGSGIIGIFYLVKYAFEIDNIKAESTVLTGLVLVSAYLFAVSLKRLKLPKLTGYMILGVIIGPIGINLLDKEILDSLNFLEHMALAFIALTAGGELKFERYKGQVRSVLYMLAGQIIVVFAGLFFLLILLYDYIPFLAAMGKSTLYGLAVLFAATAISKSPATTIGIITELEARGRITNLVLGITVIKSILLVIMFPIFIAIAKLYLYENIAFNAGLFIDLLGEVSYALLLGVMVGSTIIYYLKYVKIEKSLFLFGAAIVISELSLMFNLDILLISITAGIVVENFSKHGETLIREIERSSLPLYIIFFCFAGASLHMDTLVNAFYLTILLVISRIIFIFIGNFIGAKLAKEDTFTANYTWLGYVGQAGIALGLATIIEKALPGEIGMKFKTILIASVVVNEFIGPILFKYLLVKSGEVNKDNI